ncbi:MAG: DUF4827 domain-containing protein [Bacteroidaceae bacterium]|nr:DUF4827 domain-containing protein [Bacteroidaceae bacterium]
MTKINLRNIFFYTLLLVFMVACDDTVTYSEMKEKEVKAIKDFIKEQKIKTIKYKDFIANDSVTDVSNNEYVEIDGVYMQIVCNPKNADDARRIEDGDTRNMIVRYFEYNIQSGDTLSGNKYTGESFDEMRVTNNSGTFTAAFISGMMPTIYGSSYVPTGWLVPFSYLWFTRHTSQLAKVNLIVPHTKGTSNATTYVYPCFYEITFQPEDLFDYDEESDETDSNE